MITALSVLFIIAEIILQISLNYPPSLEQLNLRVESLNMLWIVRFTSLMAIIASIGIISKYLDSGARKFLWFFIFLSPLISLIWSSHPQDALKIILITIFYYFSRKSIKNKKVLIFTTLFLVAFLNIAVFKNKPAIVEDLTVKKAQEEVTFRFNIEDNTKPSIQVPLLVRRAVYNKYYTVFKNSFQEIVSFFDFETVFFQEIHPLGQKGVVVFFWPVAFIFIISVYYSYSKKIKGPDLIALYLIALFYFLTSSATADRRQVFTLISMSVFMAQISSEIFIGRSKLIKVFLVVLFVLTFYGWVTNLFDRKVRPEFWLDNRPLAYEFILTEIRNQNPIGYSKIIVPDTLHAIKDYCKIYTNPCPIFEFVNFDLFLNNPDKDVLYAGYTGNFMGVNASDASQSDIRRELESKEMRIFALRHILNNIASGYGQDLIIAGIKKDD